MQGGVEQADEWRAYTRQIGGHDAQAGLWIGLQLFLRPGDYGMAFSQAVGARLMRHAARAAGGELLALDSAAAGAECGEQPLFQWREAVEACQYDVLRQAAVAGLQEFDQ